ncbi:hypothetical protein [Parasitella parasitica]|uniref:Helitron helicase-like domain-containing protein n=1 Tax=Parasitella parasitica TaxID=35722 RepID=A0A0B7N2Y6_9FUNG|nr:hypothetical protein [Parasitella parasitica]
MMHEVNPFVEMFKTMEELSAEQPGGLPDLRMIFRAEGTPDERRYNRPSASEIGVLIVGGDDNDNQQPRNRDIVLRLKGPGNELSRINEIHQHFDPLQYVLMFPYGDSGWHSELRSAVPSIAEDEDVTDAADQLKIDAKRGTRRQPSKEPKNQFTLFREPVSSVYSRHVCKNGAAKIKFYPL